MKLKRKYNIKLIGAHLKNQKMIQVDYFQEKVNNWIEKWHANKVYNW